ncbi:hypothetical protein [Planktotalea sp.]|uniref:hypothetical protein n=1 Tax=Planktotalea sp. TaxID=2029877 RepID=UPI003299C3E4
MFREWGFLISEMIVLIILAALLGLFVGWLIWGRRSTVVNTEEADGLRADLKACQAKHADKDARIAALEADAGNTDVVDGLRGDLEACQATQGDKDARIAALEADLAAAKASAGAASAAVVASPVTSAEPDVAADAVDYDGDGIIEGENEGVKPATLTEARGGKADDLKQIKGIGPKLEKLCNSLGFFHFDQIANWTPQEEAWVNANLEGFKGRVSRDTWIAQAKVLAAGGETEFSKRVEGGDVY